MRKFVFSSCFALSCLAGTVEASMIEMDRQESSEPMTLAASHDSVIFEDVRFMSGTDGMVNKIGTVDAGSYQITLTDFEFPVMFDELRLALTTATRVVSILDLDESVRSVSEMVQLSGNESYYLSVFGKTASETTYGLFGVKLAQYSPVPVPASAFLLMSGLFAWGVSSLRQRKAG